MSTYRYMTTDVITGAVRADTIPLHVDSFSHNLGGVGQPGRLSGSLDLGALPSQSNLLAALEPRRTLLWVLQDNWPVWVGVIWDWPVTSVRSNQLPILADEVGSLFLRRQIREDQLGFTGFDLHDIIQILFLYGTSKTNASIAQLVYQSGSTGIVPSPAPTFPAANVPTVLDTVNQVCAQYGVEYAFDAGFTPTSALRILLRIGIAATMGRPYSATNLELIYPGNLIDYAWPRTGSTGANSVLATASGGGGAAWLSNTATHGLDSADLAAGYPLLEASVSYSGNPITAQSQIDAVADARLAQVAKSPTIGKAVLAGGQTPTVQQIQLGDHATLVATSPLHPAGPGGTPGLIVDSRIIGWTVHPASEQQTEYTELFLGGVST